MNKYDLAKYNPIYLRYKVGAEKSVKQYRQMRQVAQKRLKALSKRFPESEIYRNYKDRFPPVSTIKDDAHLYARLSELARFLNRKTSTISGQKATRKHTLETLHQHTYTYITETNLDAFADYMDTVRAAADANKYDSARVADLFETAERVGIPTEELKRDFMFWYAHRRELESLKVPKGGLSTKKIKSMIKDGKSGESARNRKQRKNNTTK